MGDFWTFLRTQKRYWIPPIVLVLAVLAYVAWKTQTLPTSPFEYRED